MGKISDTYGDCCWGCNARRRNNHAECVLCFSTMLYPILPNSCKYCSLPLNRHNAAGDDICVYCHASIQQGQNHLDYLISITYEPRLDIGYALHAYKGRTGVPQKPYMSYPLKCIVELFLNNHFQCINVNYEVNLMTFLPGNCELLLEYVNIPALPILPILQEINPHESYSNGGDRAFDTTRYNCTRRLRNQNVLLFDDVYTTGATINSAAYSLKEQGANSVIGLVLGRHISTNWNLTVTTNILEYKLSNPFNINNCVICG